MSALLQGMCLFWVGVLWMPWLQTWIAGFFCTPLCTYLHLFVEKYRTCASILPIRIVLYYCTCRCSFLAQRCMLHVAATHRLQVQTQIVIIFRYRITGYFCGPKNNAISKILGNFKLLRNDNIAIRIVTIIILLVEGIILELYTDKRCESHCNNIVIKSTLRPQTCFLRTKRTLLV